MSTVYTCMIKRVMRPGRLHPLSALPTHLSVSLPGIRPRTLLTLSARPNRSDRRSFCLRSIFISFHLFVHKKHDIQVIWHDASRSQWQEYALKIGEILHIFPSGTQSMGDRGSKKAYKGPRKGIYLPTKFGCDRSIVVGCRSRNDRQTSRQTNRME